MQRRDAFGQRRLGQTLARFPDDAEFIGLA